MHTVKTYELGKEVGGFELAVKVSLSVTGRKAIKVRVSVKYRKQKAI
jgi:hypothetical protein